MVLGVALVVVAVMFGSPFCLVVGVLNMAGSLMYENH